MKKYSNYEKIVFKKVELYDKATLNFKDGDYTFLITDSKWRARHTAGIDYKSASKEKTRIIQILRRTLPQPERQGLKYLLSQNLISLVRDDNWDGILSRIKKFTTPK